MFPKFLCVSVNQSKACIYPQSQSNAISPAPFQKRNWGVRDKGFLTASSSRAGAVLVMAFSCVYSKSWSIKFHKHKMSNIMVNQISYYSVHIKIMVNQISLEVFI